MVVTDKVVVSSIGISYTKEVDGPADHAAVPNDVYFRDKSDGQVRFKNGAGVIAELYSSGGGSTITHTGVVYVTSTGNDATGAIDDASLPFLTLSAARDAAQDGYIIIVFPGVYTVTDDLVTGLSKSSVNWYFHPTAAIQKTTGVNPIFHTVGAIVDCNVFGYADIISNVVVFKRGTELPITFQFNICSLFGAGKLYESIAPNTTVQPVLMNIRGWSLISSSSTATVIDSQITNILSIECPSIVVTNASATAISVNGGNCSIKSSRIQCAGAPAVVSDGYVNLSVDTVINGEVSVVNGDITANNLSSLRSSGLVNHTGHVDVINHLGGHARYGRCNEFNATGGGIAYVTVSDTGTNTFNFTGVSNGHYYLSQQNSSAINTALKTFTIDGANSNVHIVDYWRTRNHRFTITNGTLHLDGYFYTERQTGTITLASTGRLVLNGTLECGSVVPPVSIFSGTILSNGGTILTLNNTVPPFRAWSIPRVYKVLSGGFNTNYTGHTLNTNLLANATVTVTAVANSSITLSDGGALETFAEADVGTYNTRALLAQRLTALINASGTLDITATQAVPGTDVFFELTANTASERLRESSLINVTIVFSAVASSYSVTNSVTGTLVVQDADVAF